MNEELLGRVLSEAQKRVNESQTSPKTVHLTEFVGTAMGDTIGMVIANIDTQLHEHLGLDKKYRSIGFLSARTGGAPHIM